MKTIASRALPEYKRLRAKGWTASQALQYAKTKMEWSKLEYEDKVRLQIMPDESADYDNLAGDCFNTKYNGLTEKENERQENEFKERLNNDGVYGIVGQYFDGESWVTADSVWGFVGDDWKDSGYDSDVMRMTIDALKAVKVCPTCKRPNKGE